MFSGCARRGSVRLRGAGGALGLSSAGGAASASLRDLTRACRGLRFTGKEEDVEVGLQYFGKRFLNPLLGRWVSADPLAVHAPGEADLNLYAYVSGAVLKNVDPLGLDEEPTQADADAAHAKIEVLDNQMTELGSQREAIAAEHAEAAEAGMDDGYLAEHYDWKLGRIDDEVWDLVSQIACHQAVVDAVEQAKTSSGYELKTELRATVFNANYQHAEGQGEDAEGDYEVSETGTHKAAASVALEVTFEETKAGTVQQSSPKGEKFDFQFAFGKWGGIPLGASGEVSGIGEDGPNPMKLQAGLGVAGVALAHDGKRWGLEGGFGIGIANFIFKSDGTWQAKAGVSFQLGASTSKVDRSIVRSSEE